MSQEKHSDILTLIKEMVSIELALIKEDEVDVSQAYYQKMFKNNPEISDALEKAAMFAIKSVQREESPKDRIGKLRSILVQNSDLDPSQSGDTQGVRMFIDVLSSDRETAGKAKNFYNNVLKSFYREKFDK